MDYYVIDLCETDDGIEIVEYNCWNASGFYKTDIKKILSRITELKKGI